MTAETEGAKIKQLEHQSHSGTPLLLSLSTSSLSFQFEPLFLSFCAQALATLLTIVVFFLMPILTQAYATLREPSYANSFWLSLSVTLVVRRFLISFFSLEHASMDNGHVPN